MVAHPRALQNPTSRCKRSAAGDAGGRHCAQYATVQFRTVAAGTPRSSQAVEIAEGWNFGEGQHCSENHTMQLLMQQLINA